MNVWIFLPRTFCVVGMDIEIPIPDPGNTDKTLYYDRKSKKCLNMWIHNTSVYMPT